MRCGITPYVCTLALVTLLILPRSVFAERHNPDGQISKPLSELSVVRDISLSRDGRVKGQLVDRQGNPKSAIKIAVQRSDGMVVARVITDKDGRFVLSGLQGGQYMVRYGHDSIVTRIWVEGTSPPSARNSILLVADDLAVRGQSFPGQIGLSRAAAASAAASVAVGKTALGNINAKPPTPADPPPAS